MRRAFLISLAAGCCITSTAWATDPVQVDYMLNCQGCHLPDGSGYPARDVPDLRNHMGVFLHVDGGREYLIQVPGAAQSDLDDDRLASVINWMLQTFSPNELPAEFEPYTAREVAQARVHPLTEVLRTREALLRDLQSQASDTGSVEGSNE